MPIILLLLFVSAVSAGSSTRTIVFLGDSLTAGYGLSEDSAYPALVQKFLEGEGLDWKVVNAGISGDTTRGGLKRLEWVLKSSPTLVFVALGANDGLRGLELGSTRANIEAMILRLKKSGVGIILSGMQLPVNYGEPYRGRFREMFAALAKKHSVPYFPFLLEGVAMHSDLNLPDGVHPNEKGQEIIAKQVYKFLLPLLRKS